MSTVRDDITINPIEETSSPWGTTKPPIKSIVWKHFEKIVNEITNKVDRAKCIYCEKMLKYNSNNGTSGMHKHLSSCKKYPHNVDKTQTILSSFNTSSNDEGRDSSMVSSWRFNQEVTRQLLAEYIIIEEVPFRKVEQPAFKRLLSSMNPLWNNISRHTVARDIVNIYNCEKVALKNNLCRLKYRIALTTDLWTSNQNISYLCLTGHYIDESWVLHKKILSFVPISSHKGREIGKLVEKCIFDWGIERHVSTITLDNATANDVAAVYLRRRLADGSGLILNGNYFQMRCTAHIMNLIVKDGLSESRDCINRIRNSVKYVRSSPARAEAFQRCVKEERITYKGGVCLDVVTRWNSTFLMLDSAIKFRKAFRRLQDDDPNYTIDLLNDTPSDEDWETAIVFAKFLKKFYEATKRMSGTKYVTANRYFYEMISIFLTLDEWGKDSNPNLQSMSKKMKGKFDKYYGGLDKVNLMVLIAAILDPRYKLTYLEWGYKRIYNNDLQQTDRIIELVKELLHKLYEHYEHLKTHSQHSQASSSFQSMGSDQSVGVVGDCVTDCNERDLAMDLFFQDMGPNICVVSKSELEIYLDEVCLPLQTELNVLEWWKSNTVRFKTLSHMARDIFAIPVSTVASESAFSTSGRVLDQFRSSLSTPVVEALICTQDWLTNAYAPTPPTFEEYLEDANVYDTAFKAFLIQQGISFESAPDT